jgi:myo-inositol-1(or 4)-monophosphatase
MFLNFLFFKRIDSIDGTINFVKKIHLVCISVALTVDRDLKIGYLYNPVLNEFFSAKKGHGAFLNGERIEASKNQEFEDSVMAHEFSLGYIKPYLPKYIERGKEFIKHCIGVRSFGSAALTLGYIAKGAIDAYSIEDLKCWDIAAGALIVQEAGGVILNKDGGEYNIMRPDIIAAGNLTLANKVKEIIQKVDEELEQKGMLPHQLIFK